jgi:peptide/nickel transport system ATP-binding protein
LSQVPLIYNASREEPNVPLLRIEDLSVSFSRQRGLLNRQEGVVKAVRNISLDIFESEVVALVGESGSGKTTTANCILGIVQPTSGVVLFEGKPVSNLTGNSLREFRRDVQIIYQDPYESLNPRRSVLSTLSIPIQRLKGVRGSSKIRETAENLLGEVGLNPSVALDKYPHQLSGGERQRVNIARALASDPKLLIADEPVTMLDASQKINILSLLKRLKEKRNLTLLLVTHDLAVAKVVSQRVVVMYAGLILESGRTKELLARPFHPYSELLIASTPSLDLIEEIPFDKRSQDPDFLERPTVGCVFRPRCKYALAACKETQPNLDAMPSGRNVACYNATNQLPNPK